jgi:hypothetical protein
VDFFCIRQDGRKTRYCAVLLAAVTIGRWNEA